jgi:long-chain acyl-CoA synthetase
MEINRVPSADFTRIFDILEYQRTKFPNRSALNKFDQGKWKPISIDTIILQSEILACWFIQQGYAKGDRIVFVPVIGSPGWMILDFACQQAGLIVVPVHPTAADHEIVNIISETESRLCIAADALLFHKFNQAVKNATLSIPVVHLQPGEEGYFEAMEHPEATSDIRHQLHRIKDSITPDDLMCILYTSGSSGIPKGVMLTHQNVVTSIKAILTLLPLEPGQRVLSFLPFSHIFERTSTYAYMAFGLSVFFSKRKETFAFDFKSVKPHFCTSVPRVLEKMYDYMVEQTLQHNWLKRNVILWAIKVGKLHRPGLRNPILSIQLLFARWLVLGQWRKKLGGKIKYMVVGAASLQPEIARLFTAAGIQVAEGYGMTETSPFISVNRFEPGLNRFGTAGLPIPGIDLMIDNPNEEGEGEILVKGQNVMKGYYKQPHLTQQVFTEDGWFRTGDVGKITDNRFLVITDRKKDIFKTTTGKYIAPLVLQNHFRKSPFIERCLIIGFNKPFVTALIVPNFEWLELWCRQERIHWTAPEFMVYNIKVRGQYQQEINQLNKELSSHERVKDFVLCHQDWTVESGELTTTLKPVRHLLMDHYQKEVDRMYS